MSKLTNLIKMFYREFNFKLFFFITILFNLLFMYYLIQIKSIDLEFFTLLIYLFNNDTSQSLIDLLIGISPFCLLIYFFSLNATLDINSRSEYILPRIGSINILLIARSIFVGFIINIYFGVVFFLAIPIYILYTTEESLQKILIFMLNPLNILLILSLIFGYIVICLFHLIITYIIQNNIISYLIIVIMLLNIRLLHINYLPGPNILVNSYNKDILFTILTSLLYSFISISIILLVGKIYLSNLDIIKKKEI